MDKKALLWRVEAQVDSAERSRLTGSIVIEFEAGVAVRLTRSSTESFTAGDASKPANVERRGYFFPDDKKQ